MRAYEVFAAMTPEFKTKLENGASLDDILPDAFAVVRETANRNEFRRVHCFRRTASNSIRDFGSVGQVICHQRDSIS